MCFAPPGRAFFQVSISQVFQASGGVFLFKFFTSKIACQHPKRSTSAFFFLKNRKPGAEVAASYIPVPKRFSFSNHICLKYCICDEKVKPRHTKCCTHHAKHFSRPEGLMLQNATHLRKSPPWPGDVSYVALGTPDAVAFLQILFKCTTHTIPLEIATKPTPFCPRPIRKKRETRNTFRAGF